MEGGGVLTRTPGQTSGTRADTKGGAKNTQKKNTTGRNTTATESGPSHYLCSTPDWINDTPTYNKTATTNGNTTETTQHTH